MNRARQDLPLIVVGGWGVDASMLAPVVRNWPAEVRYESLNDELLAGCGSISEVAEVLTRRHPEPMVWLGWSQGAQVAMAAAGVKDSPVQSVVTVAGFPRFVKAPEWPCGMEPDTFQAFEAGLNSNAQRTWRRFQQLMIHGCRQSERSEARQELMTWIESGPAASSAHLAKGLLWLADEDQRKTWQYSDVPALHLLGSDDALVAPWHQQLSLPECAECRVIPGMTHWPRGQHAINCARSMAEFFTQQQEVV